jgi:hypothetical protein
MQGGGQEGEMTQTMYAHVNKWVIKKKENASFWIQMLKEVCLFFLTL